MKRVMKNLVASLAVCVVLAGMSAMARGADVVSKTVRLTVGKADTVQLPRAVADVLVANPAVADIGSLRADRLYAVGRAVGNTNVLAFDDQGNQLANIIIQVRIDDNTLSDTVREFFPGEHVQARTVNDSIVLTGRVSMPTVANQIRDLIGRFVPAGGPTIVDLTTVAGEQQVMLKVRVLEAKRDILREMGVNTTLNVNPNGRNPFKLTQGGLGFTSTPFGTGVLTLGGWNDFGPLTSDIEGLERDGFVNTLAEPTLTAISGETAGFLAGGEFPVPASRDQDGNIVVTFKQFGVALNFIPTVLSNDRISLQLNSEVSSRSDADGVTLQGLTIPGINVRRASTTVQMGSGGTMMIAGLLNSATTHTMNGLPGIENVPILGALFKSKSFQRGESELVFLVTPYIVEPYADGEVSRVASADGQMGEIVTTSHGVSLSAPSPHTTAVMPASSVIWSDKPSSAPGAVPVRGAAPAPAATRVHRSSSDFRANYPGSASRPAVASAPPAVPVESVAAMPLIAPASGGPATAAAIDQSNAGWMLPVKKPAKKVSEKAPPAKTAAPAAPKEAYVKPQPTPMTGGPVSGYIIN